MRLVRVFMMLGVLAVVSGCATLSYPLPKCDGYAKRPLNRSMWEWEGGKQPTAEQHSSLDAEDTRKLAYVPAEEAETTVQTVFTNFNEAGSHRACQAG